MKKLLEVIDGAVKRLVTPVAMLVAAGLLSKGLSNKDASYLVVSFLIVVLALWALGYMVLSVIVAIKELEQEGVSKVAAAMLGTSFILVYMVLFLVALNFGLGKLE
ncbi:hypothetical protein CXK92_12745 [Stutzerimonas stutzeri]|uniref:Uncharacterized protein n=1 Tax=Stutzerimonas stutzeri TaxID=316 RepID=A0A2N8S3C8_STUST|nr:hypothetical protein CXK92_12745 [Stutzerimonas stutzeri]